MARLARRWILVFCQVEAAMKWRAALEAGGAVYKRTCQWIKPDGKPQYSGDRPGIGYESIVACHAPGRSRWNGGGSHGVFIVNKGGDQRTGHQTQKPLALMDVLVRPFSEPGELILDPFAGSGTTGVAALRLGRRFEGWEMNPEYAAITRRRLANAREQLIGLVHPVARLSDDRAWIDGHASVGLGLTFDTGHWHLPVREDLTFAFAATRWLTMRGGLGVGLTLDTSAESRSFAELALPVGLTFFHTIDLVYRPMLSVPLGSETSPVFEGAREISTRLAVLPFELLLRVRIGALGW